MAWKAGSTRAWRRLRAQILLRDRYQCRAHTDGWCDARPAPHACIGATLPAAPIRHWHAHHTLGRAVTGDDPRHIVASCAPCNQHIGEPDAERIDPPVQPVTDWRRA